MTKKFSMQLSFQLQATFFLLFFYINYYFAYFFFELIIRNRKKIPSNNFFTTSATTTTSFFVSLSPLQFFFTIYSSRCWCLRIARYIKTEVYLLTYSIYRKYSVNIDSKNVVSIHIYFLEVVRLGKVLSISKQ